MITPSDAQAPSQVVALAPSDAAQETFQRVSWLGGVYSDILDVYRRDFAGRGRGGWRAVGEILGVSGGTAYEMAYGRRLISHEQALRWRVWQEVIGHNNPNVQIVSTVTCPSCGKLHQVTDCHGQAGEVAIIPAGALPPGARIVEPSEAKPKRSRKCDEAWRPYIPARHRAALEPLIADWLTAQSKETAP